jgi:hypothetical protein
VVLDRTLSVVGLGTKINVPREQAEKSPIQFKNVESFFQVIIELT